MTFEAVNSRIIVLADDHLLSYIIVGKGRLSTSVKTASDHSSPGKQGNSQHPLAKFFFFVRDVLHSFTVIECNELHD